MIKESWNLIGQEAHLATPYFNDYLYAQNPTGSFPRYCWSKNPAIWLDERQNWSHLTEVSSLRWYHFLMTNFLQKKKPINWFFPMELLIKKFSNLTEWEAQLAKSKQKS